MSKENPVPICDRCKNPMALKVVEHVMAPQTPTLVLKTYTCETCHPPKT